MGQDPRINSLPKILTKLRKEYGVHTRKIPVEATVQLLPYLQ